MKILVTGYKGFIAQNLIPQLSDHEVSVFEWGEDEPVIEGLDWVIHLGAESSTTETDVEKVMTKNYDFSMWLLSKCIDHGVNMQYASSASVYGKGIEFNEESPKDPRTPYAWSKYLFDRDAFQLNHAGKIILQGMRYFNVYGPHEDHKGSQASVYHQFQQQFSETGRVKVFEGSENFYRDFVYVNDAISMQMALMETGHNGVWNIGSGKITSIMDVAKLFTNDIDVIPFPKNLVHSYQEHTCADITKLRQTLGI